MAAQPRPRSTMWQNAPALACGAAFVPLTLLAGDAVAQIVLCLLFLALAMLAGRQRAGGGVRRLLGLGSTASDLRAGCAVAALFCGLGLANLLSPGGRSWSVEVALLEGACAAVAVLLTVQSARGRRNRS